MFHVAKRLDQGDDGQRVFLGQLGNPGYLLNKARWFVPAYEQSSVIAQLPEQSSVIYAVNSITNLGDLCSHLLNKALWFMSAPLKQSSVILEAPSWTKLGDPCHLLTKLPNLSQWNWSFRPIMWCFPFSFGPPEMPLFVCDQWKGRNWETVKDSN